MGRIREFLLTSQYMKNPARISVRHGGQGMENAYLNGNILIDNVSDFCAPRDMDSDGVWVFKYKTDMAESYRYMLVSQLDGAVIKRDVDDLRFDNGLYSYVSPDEKNPEQRKYMCSSGGKIVLDNSDYMHRFHNRMVFARVGGSDSLGTLYTTDTRPLLDAGYIVEGFTGTESFVPTPYVFRYYKDRNPSDRPQLFALGRHDGLDLLLRDCINIVQITDRIVFYKHEDNVPNYCILDAAGNNILLDKIINPTQIDETHFHYSTAPYESNYLYHDWELRDMQRLAHISNDKMLDDKLIADMSNYMQRDVYRRLDAARRALAHMPHTIKYRALPYWMGGQQKYNYYPMYICEQLRLDKSYNG